MVAINSPSVISTKIDESLFMNQTLSQSKYADVLLVLQQQSCLSEAQSRQLSSSKSDDMRALIDNGLVPELAIAEALSSVFQCPLLRREQLDVNKVAGTQELGNFLLEHEALPLSFVNGELNLAVSDPSDEFTLQVLRAKLKCAIKLHVAVRSELLDVLTSHYSSPVSVEEINHTLDVPDDLDSNSGLVRELHRLIQRAISLNASDIHFEPIESCLRVRFRVHGMLRNIHQFDKNQSDQVIARLKLMSKLDVTERRHAQNGRFKFPADGRVVDLRVSTLPLHDGESVVLRLLEFGLSQLGLQDLGFSESIASSMEQAISTQQGLVLVTGPTGSGKSTTLYSLLNQLNKQELKLISIEDPVELNVAGINQIQVDDEYGVSFSAALKTVLRQDPDVIMVGEIRDAETAQLAAQAALTGHLVLATLHTASAASAITRLQNLGLPEYLISATLKAVLAQRLLRCQCNDCSTDSDSRHCLSCFGAKYSGRTTIAELLPLTAFNDLLDTSEGVLSSRLLDGNTLRDDAQRLLAEGVTDQAEVFRVLGFSESSHSV